jgi:glycosyltransferase involved in cell wall biosynthesis
LFDQLRTEGVETRIVRETSSFDIRSLLRTGAIARDLRVDVIHSHLFGSTVRAGLLSRLRQIPAIGTIHGHLDLNPGERFHLLKTGIVRFGLRRVVFVSEGLRESCAGPMGLAPSQTAVIHNGVDPKIFMPATSPSEFRQEFGLGADEFVVGYVGRLQPIKRVDVFLRAAAILSSSTAKYRFVIVGNGDPAHTQALIAMRDALGLIDSVTFVGFRPDVQHAMAAFDVYALTSQSEGFSLSTIEAMASGVPVVATRCGGPEQILDDGISGLLVDNGSPEGVARAIQRLRLDSAERRRLGDAGRAAVLARFTVDVQVANYERLYEEVLTSAMTRLTIPDNHLGVGDSRAE